MFNPEKEVPSLELCKRLEELGFSQEGGGWYWIVVQGCKHKDVKWELKFYEKYEDIPYWALCYKAPTVRELGEWLPPIVKTKGRIYRLVIKKRIGGVNSDTENDDYLVLYQQGNGGILEYFSCDFEADVRAKTLIWLVENGYMELKEVNNG